jgi:hypothetical protein
MTDLIGSIVKRRSTRSTTSTRENPLSYGSFLKPLNGRSGGSHVPFKGVRRDSVINSLLPGELR